VKIDKTNETDDAGYGTPWREVVSVRCCWCVVTVMLREMWVAFGNILHGWAVVTHDGIDEGLAELRRGLSAFELTGVKLWQPFFLGLLADALTRAGPRRRGPERRYGPADEAGGQTFRLFFP
jgi:hypothetical protein